MCWAAAQVALARCYWSGWGVNKDLEAAAKWYEASAEQGLGHAQFNLGRC